MRISTSLLYQRGVDSINQQQTEMSKTQQQLATGERLGAPADDPFAATRINTLDDQTARLDQYTRNADFAKTRLEIEENALTSSVDALQRLHELAVQMANGTYTEEDRISVSYEAAQIRDALFQYANTLDEDGEYLFSGNKVQTATYVADGDGNYIYQGDQGQRYIQIGSSRTVPTGDSGYEVWENIQVAGSYETRNLSTLDFSGVASTKATYTVPDTSVPGPSTTSPLLLNGYTYSVDPIEFELTLDGGLSSTVITLDKDTSSRQETIDLINLKFKESGIDATASVDLSGYLSIETNSYGADTSIEILGVDQNPDGNTTFAIDFISGGVPNPALGSTGDSLTFDVDGFGVILNSDYTGNMAGLITDLQAQLDGLDGGNAAGAYRAVAVDKDSFRIEAVNKGAANTPYQALVDNFQPTTIEGASGGRQIIGQERNIIEIAADFAANLAAGNKDENALVSIKASIDRLVSIRSAIGGRINSIDSEISSNESIGLVIDKNKSDLKDLDYADAISRFQQQLAGLQAAQQTFVQVQGLSLFNYI